MGGILYKSIAGQKSGAETVKDLQENLNRWADQGLNDDEIHRVSVVNPAAIASAN
jgi:hypothetical protein